MDKKDDLLRRPLYLYSLPPTVLDSLSYKDIATIEAEAEAAEKVETADTEAKAEEKADTNTDTKTDTTSTGSCWTCSLTFDSPDDRKSHYKSDLHLYNLKQKLRKQPTVDEATFEKLATHLEESLSGSDWSSEEEEDEKEEKNADKTLSSLLKKAVLTEDNDTNNTQKRSNKQDRKAAAEAAKHQPLLWFSSPVLSANHYFGVYRAIFTAEELQDLSDNKPVEAIRSRQLTPVGGANKVETAAATASKPYNGRHMFLCMIGGGHFAAMVVALAPRKIKPGSVAMNREATVLAHKTFHRYTTRRKQGGAQSANDAAKGAAHSAGSSLRRYNEQALVEDVRTLLAEWKGLLDTADLLFVRATGTTNQRTLFGPYEGQVLQARDPRLRSFPFNTKRPTQNEMMRAFIELTRLKVREIVVEAKPTVKAAAAAAAVSKTPKPKPKPERNEEYETALLHTQQLQALAKRSKVPALLAYLKNNDLAAATFRFVPTDAAQHHHAPTLLHLAASQNSPALVQALLVRAGADPTVSNGDGKPAYDLAGDRATRDAFRVGRGLLEAEEAKERTQKVDWQKTHIPSAMTAAEAEQRTNREKQEAADQEADRRRREEAELAKKTMPTKFTAAGGRLAKGAPKSAQEIRDEEARGLTPEQRQRLERERRARAAEARIRRMQSGGV